MRWTDELGAHLLALPKLAKFAIVMVGIAGASALCRRLRIPDLVGLLAFGVLLGPHVLDVAGADHPIAQFFAKLGILMLMFTAGLEISIPLFRQVQPRCIAFGVITAMVPLLAGAAVGLAFGYPIIPAIVVGSLLASHTLIGLPIITRLEAMRLEPVVVTVGATLVSDTLSLIIFGICVSAYTVGFSASSLIVQIVEVAIFVPAILIGGSRGGAWLLGKLRHNEESYFVTMLGIMAIAGVLAELINLPGIVGAFLAGLAVNAATTDHPAKEKLEFVGKAFFIPIFFVVTGFLVSPVAVAETIRSHLLLVAAIVGALVLGKGVAAMIAGRAFGYTRPATLTMWALTLPQLAATLAATLVGYDTFNAAGERLLDEKMFNTQLVLVVVTSTLGPILTGRFAPTLVGQDAGGVAIEDAAEDAPPHPTPTA